MQTGNQKLSSNYNYVVALVHQNSEDETGVAMRVHRIKPEMQTAMECVRD